MAAAGRRIAGARHFQIAELVTSANSPDGARASFNTKAGGARRAGLPHSRDVGERARKGA
jgi:hypothetical protein